MDLLRNSSGHLLRSPSGDLSSGTTSSLCCCPSCPSDCSGCSNFTMIQCPTGGNSSNLDCGAYTYGSCSIGPMTLADGALQYGSCVWNGPASVWGYVWCISAYWELGNPGGAFGAIGTTCPQMGQYACTGNLPAGTFKLDNSSVVLPGVINNVTTPLTYLSITLSGLPKELSMFNSTFSLGNPFGGGGNPKFGWSFSLPHPTFCSPFGGGSIEQNYVTAGAGVYWTLYISNNAGGQFGGLSQLRFVFAPTDAILPPTSGTYIADGLWDIGTGPIPFTAMLVIH